MDFSKDGRSTLEVFIFQMVDWKTVPHGICKWPLCDRAQLWMFYLNIFRSPNAKMTPVHTFEVFRKNSSFLALQLEFALKNHQGVI